MRVMNTSRFSNDLVREAIKHCKPAGIRNFDVMVKNSAGSYAGTSYSKGSGYHCTANPFIVVRIGEENWFPCKTWDGKKEYDTTEILESTPVKDLGHGITICKATKTKVVHVKTSKGYIPSLLLSGEEALVHVLAHELRHLWQAKHKNGKVWGARGRFSERDADAYAIRKTREWRKLNFGGA